MLRIIPKRSRERDSHTARVQKFRCDPLPPRFTNPCFSRSAMSCRILRGTSNYHQKNNFKATPNSQSSPQLSCVRGRVQTKKHRLHEYHGYNFAIGHSRFVILRLSAKSAVFRAVLIDRKRDITDRTSSSNFRKHWCTLVLAEP